MQYAFYVTITALYVMVKNQFGRRSLCCGSGFWTFQSLACFLGCENDAVPLCACPIR